MALLVLGRSETAAVTAAAVAAMGVDVRRWSPDEPAGDWSVHVTGAGLDRAVRIAVVPEPEPGPGDVVVVVAPLGEERTDLVLRHRAILAGHPVVLAPSGCGGGVRLRRQLLTAGGPMPVLVEATGFPVLGRVAERRVEVSAIKRQLPVAVLAGSSQVDALRLVTEAIPWAVPVASVLETSLANTNTLIHPPLSVFNAARIAEGRPFRFYREGCPPAASEWMETLDRERLALTDDLGSPRVTLAGWLDRFYADQGMAGRDAAERLRTFAPFADSPAPLTFHHRYLDDDVRDGLAVMEALAQRRGISTPFLSALVTMASLLLGVDARDGADAVAGLLADEHAATAATSTPRA